MRICSIEGCAAPHFGKTYCNNHYRRFRRHGDPLGGRVPFGEPMKFLAAAVGSKTKECIVWPYGKSNTGHGMITHKGKEVPAHRLALSMATKIPLSTSLLACHGPCHNPSCINPTHLTWQTAKQNYEDRARDGTKPEGEQNPSSKLTEKSVLEIRKSNLLHRVVAERYGVSRSSITAVKSRKTWRHI